jgi:signal transduction histidine kinase
LHADGTAATSLGLAQARAQQALDRVRAIAHHLYPAALGDAGLAAALDVLSEWRPHVELHELPDERFPAPVEAGGYFLVAALTRSSARAVVSASDEPGRLVVEVRTARPGDLVEVEDRVGALGGRLTVEPGANGAIHLRAELPCES